MMSGNDKWSNNLFIYVNGMPFSIGDLGNIADMRLDEALQHMVDKGMAGDFPADTPWYHVFKSDCITLVSEPKDPEEELLRVLYDSFKEYEAECMGLLAEGKFTEENRSELANRLQRFQMAKKLSKV